METVSFNIPSLSCSICSGKIMDGVKSLAGIGDVLADLKSQTVKVTYNPSDTNPQEIKKAIASLGFEVLQS